MMAARKLCFGRKKRLRVCGQMLCLEERGGIKACFVISRVWCWEVCRDDYHTDESYLTVNGIFQTQTKEDGGVIEQTAYLSGGEE